VTLGAKPRKGRRVVFNAADGAAPELRPGSLAGLRFTIEAAYGGTALVDFVALRPRRLALAFAGALRTASGIGGPLGAASTIKQHAQAYPSFFDYLQAHARQVSGPEDLRRAHIDGFETWLEAGSGPIGRRITLCKVIVALRTVALEHPGLLDRELEHRLAYTSMQPFQHSRPRDAYSPFVARQLRDAARADLDAIRTRLRSPIIASGNAGIDARRVAIEVVLDRCGSINYAHPAFKRLYFYRYNDSARSPVLISEIHGRRHLTGADIVPLVILLSLATGLEIECCKALTADCLRNPSRDTVEIAYVKRRARGSEHKRLRVRDGALTTPGGLIRLILDMTAEARRHCASESLWVYYQAGVLRSGIRHPHQQVAAWAARHGIMDDEGQPLHLLLTRLRKTHKALWYVWTQGDMARFAVGHTEEVAARHYAEVPALRHLHEAAIAAGLTDALAGAASGPLILPPAAEQRVRADTSIAHPAPDEVAALLDGAQDVWLTSCGGFYDSPFGRTGEPCPQPFWGCFECANAVFTARKLPALLAFLDLVTAERARLGAADWSAKFGQVYARITQQILPAFPDALVAQARSTAGQAREDLYLSPETLA